VRDARVSRLAGVLTSLKPYEASSACEAGERRAI
jgi:hypothetical protein